MPIRRTSIVLIIAFMAPQLALAEGSRPPEWWEVTTGVLAIPAAILGLVYSYLLLKKTRLESRKTELEIHEKEAKLRRVVAGDSDFVKELLQPVINARAGQLLVLRFIVLYLVLQAWNLVERAFALLFKGAVIGVTALLGDNWSSPNWLIVPYVILNYLPEIVYYAIFILLGWPLFRDISGVLGLDVRDFFSLRGLKADPKKDTQERLAPEAPNPGPQPDGTAGAVPRG